MAIKFGDVHGEAIKNNIDYYKFTEGKNHFRLVGEVLPRYVYWNKSPDGNKNLSVECLAFDRDLEKFTNTEKDYFQEYFPDKKCSWSYLVQVIDLDEGEDKGKVKVLGLKKKLFQQILEVANEHHGDPTDPDKGWDCVVSRKKTGPLSYNVEYTLDQLASKPRALSPTEKEAIADLKPIEQLFPRPTPAEQKAFIEKVWFSEDEDDVPEEAKEAAAKEKFEEDIPF